MTSRLLTARRLTESRFTDSCTVKRATGTTTTDPVTLEEVPVMAVVLAGVKCKIKTSGVDATNADIPGQVAASTATEWHCPIGTVGVRTGDRVTIDAVDPVVGDPELVGKVFRIEGPFLRDNATARRFRVELWS